MGFILESKIKISKNVVIYFLFSDTFGYFSSGILCYKNDEKDYLLKKGKYIFICNKTSLCTCTSLCIIH